MAATAETTTVMYELEGTLLEACSCGVLCPCWIGEDPDGGTCDAFNAYHFDRGTIRGVDVSGLNYVRVVHIPGNVLTPASWQQVVFVDERRSDEQRQAILDAYDGQARRAARRPRRADRRDARRRAAPITHEVHDGKGRLTIGDVVHSEMHPYTGPDGSTTTLRDSLFSTVPGVARLRRRRRQARRAAAAVRHGVVAGGSQRDPGRLPDPARGMSQRPPTHRAAAACRAAVVGAIAVARGRWRSVAPRSADAAQRCTTTR